MSPTDNALEEAIRMPVTVDCPVCYAKTGYRCHDRAYERPHTERLMAVMRALFEAAAPDRAGTDTAHRDGLRRAVQQWAMVNEIAAPPLDWAGLGAILRPPEDAPDGSQVQDIPGDAASAAAEGSGAGVRTSAERPERLPTSPDPAPARDPLRCYKASAFGDDYCGVHRTRDWPCPHAREVAE